MAFPDWVLKQKKQGYEIKYIRGKFYMYKLKSKWDPQKGKAKKVSGEYIGKVTPNGIILKKQRISPTITIFSLEYGATSFITTLARDILEKLKNHFNIGLAQRIFTSAVLRLIAHCPFSRLGDHYETSWMSKLLPDLVFSPASITRFLDFVGGSREACTDFMRETMGASPFYLVDGTRTVSSSDGVLRAVPGHSKTKGFLPRLNQIYIMAVSESGGVPVFYRNAAGNIPDVTALRLTMEDAKIQDATFIGDTGFGSEVNFTLLTENGIKYIVPLKRNTSEVELENVVFTDVFTYHHRTIWAYSEEKNGYRICVFRDEKLRSNEITDFVERVEKTNATLKAKRTFEPSKDVLRDISLETIGKDAEFGVIVIRTSLMEAEPKKIYESYKYRYEIEQLFDTMRNVCNNDTSYMHDDAGFEAWSFIGHITLMVACRILSLLKEKKMLQQWSLSGILDHLSRIYAVKIADDWRIAEVTKKTRVLTEKLGLDLSTFHAYLPNN
jgi:hypothetical protein